MYKSIFLRLLLLLLLVLFTGACSHRSKPTADAIVFNGRIATMDQEMPLVEALAIRGDTILAVGSRNNIEALAGSHTRRIDLQGALAIPGFIDAHAHLMNLGRLRQQLDLTAARSWDEIIDIVAERAKTAAPGSWIVGRGWHQEKWDTPPARMVEGYPVHQMLSAAVPDYPVFLKSSNGHAVFVNARAMDLAGINRETADPPGGKILRDNAGNPTGAMLEEAERLFEPLFDAANLADPQGFAAREKEAARKGAAECLANGITSLHEAGLYFETIDLLREMAANGELGIRLWVMIGSDNRNLPGKIGAYAGIHREGRNHFTVGGIKAYMDGALGSRGAWLLEPYSDLPYSSGIPAISPDSLQVLAELAARHHLQMATHAIGDRGNREVLQVYRHTIGQFPEIRERRWRIEHAQHLHPDDIPQFAGLGVTASMQGIHCTSDAPWVARRLGDERAASGAYVWRKLLAAGALVVNGTDAPVEAINPIKNIYSSVTRRRSDGITFYPEQSMTRQEALRSYTINAAKAVFEDDIKGSLAPGKLADITVLSQDILTIPEEQLLQTTVVYTIVGGEIRYSAR